MGVFNIELDSMTACHGYALKRAIGVAVVRDMDGQLNWKQTSVTVDDDIYEPGRAVDLLDKQFFDDSLPDVGRGCQTAAAIIVRECLRHHHADGVNTEPWPETDYRLEHVSSIVVLDPHSNPFSLNEDSRLHTAPDGESLQALTGADTRDAVIRFPYLSPVSELPPYAWAESYRGGANVLIGVELQLRSATYIVKRESLPDASLIPDAPLAPGFLEL